MGVQDIGAVYATAADHALHHEDVERTAAALRLTVREFRAEGDPSGLARSFAPGTPAILLFLGGTPELAQLTQGLERQTRQRYLVALADVNPAMDVGGFRVSFDARRRGGSFVTQSILLPDGRMVG